jgi:hypothetical protein
MLYHTGKLSERQAREALGITRRAFEELLPRFGLSILIDSQEISRLNWALEPRSARHQRYRSVDIS